MYAERRGFPLRDASVKVELDDSNPDEAIFREELEFFGDLTDEQRARLSEIAGRCSVQKTLSKRIRFERHSAHEPVREGDLNDQR